MLNAFKQLSIEKQEKIINASASIFAEEGYHYGSISDICSRSGISNGALYKYFKNKEALYFAVLDHIISLVETELYKKYIEDMKDLYEDMQRFLEALGEFTKKYPDYIAIYSDLGSSSMNRFAFEISGKFKIATTDYTVKMIEESIERGDIDSNIKSSIAAYMVDSYITLFAYSLVSDYHNKRFNSFFTKGDKELTEEEKIDLIIESLRLAFKK